MFGRPKPFIRYAKRKLNADFVPRWQQEWDKLPRAKNQTVKGPREHPKPTWPPHIDNHTRMEIRAKRREQMREAQRNG